MLSLLLNTGGGSSSRIRVSGCRLATVIVHGRKGTNTRTSQRRSLSTVHELGLEVDASWLAVQGPQLKASDPIYIPVLPGAAVNISHCDAEVGSNLIVEIPIVSTTQIERLNQGRQCHLRITTF